VLTALVGVARAACQIKGFGFMESRVTGSLLEGVLATTLRQHLLTDAEGLISFIQQTDGQGLTDLEYQGLASCLEQARQLLGRSLSPYSKKPTTHPHLCLAALQLETGHFAFEPDRSFERRLADVLSSAEKLGMTAVVEAARRFKTLIDQRLQPPADFEDDFEEDDLPPQSTGGERITEDDFKNVPPELMILLVELGAAVIDGDAQVIARLRAQAVAGGMSGALFDKFVRTAPKTGSKPGQQKPKPSRARNQPVLDLF
jgi:hypothetical protein